MMNTHGKLSRQFLETVIRRMRTGILFVTALMVLGGCQSRSPLTREQVLEEFPRICRQKYQAQMSCRAQGDTAWFYLPYTGGRYGLGGTKEDNNDLLLEYQIGSFNPYRVVLPPELKFLVQKVLGEIRALQLRCKKPFTFSVLVVSDITAEEAKMEKYDDAYIAYFSDIKHFAAGRDFRGEGYARLVPSKELVGLHPNESGKFVYNSYRDTKGEHLNYRDMTMKEFVVKQIKWRIEKRFSIEYTTVPFDLAAQERKDAIIGIVKHVLSAYNFKGFEKVYLKDSTFLEEEESFLAYPREEIEKHRGLSPLRKPAF